VRTEIETMTKQLEDYTNEGEIDKAQELMERLEALKKEKEQIEAKMPNTKEQQLIVCEVCAALLSVNESDQRLADHFAGKMHLGFQKIRDKLKELKELRSYEDRRQRDTDRARTRKGHEEDDFERDYDRHRKGRQPPSETSNRDGNIPYQETDQYHHGGGSGGRDRSSPPSSRYRPRDSSDRYHHHKSHNRDYHSSRDSYDSGRSSDRRRYDDSRSYR
jgi:RNA-binding protein Luc7-like 2